MTDAPAGKYDIIIVAVPHHAYLHMDESDFAEMANNDAIVVDLKNLYKGKIKSLNYWTL